MANLTTCSGCVYFGKIQHKQKYVCRFPGGLAKVKPNTWCCYAKPYSKSETENKKGDQA